jgi:DNA-binding response OmpR family regulator
MSRILIIEDQPEIRRLIKWALEFDEHEIQEAMNGETGLGLIRIWRPDLVLLDVMMPGDIDGLAVCRQIRADPDYAAMPIILLSARAQASDRRAGELAGADAYMIKPFSPIELTDLITSLLNKAPKPAAARQATRGV